MKREKTPRFVCLYCKGTQPAAGSIGYTCYCDVCGSIMLARR